MRPSKANTKTGALPGTSELFPTSESGWQGVSNEDKARIDAFASDYLGFLRGSGTQRAAASAIAELARSAGALPFDQSAKHKAGQVLMWQDEAQSSLALLRIGELPAQEGLHVIVASTDGAVIRLTPSPSYEKSGLALFDTTILGDLDLESWLNTPLLLDITLADAQGAIVKQVRIGDQADEPVFTIPDLLPHLSRKVQREGLVDSPERLDALAAFSLQGLAQGLKRYGLRTTDWNRAEAELLPAQEASYIGVDRALIAGSNHAARAFPYAAARALLENPSKHSTLVILMGHSERSYAGAGAEAHIANLLPLAIAQQIAKPDALDLRRIYARTKVMLYDHEGGARNKGVVLNSRKDDATPEAFRYLLQRFEKAKLQFQILEESGWSEAREVASLDMDAVEVGLPIEGAGTPSALISTLDLYQALLACQAWVQQ
jgi:aspartyl aminopeptidase